MGMPVAHPGWTIAMLDALPESSERHEIIDGELFVTPAPSEGHALVVTALLVQLHRHLEGLDVGRVITAPTDVWRDDRMYNRVQPDVLVMRYIDGKRPPYPYHLRDLLLAIEVASPGNPLLDYQVKRDLYLREGVGEYWVVNIDARNISRWRGRDDPGEVLSCRIEWQPSESVAPFGLDLPSFFEAALR